MPLTHREIAKLWDMPKVIAPENYPEPQMSGILVLLFALPIPLIGAASLSLWGLFKGTVVAYIVYVLYVLLTYETCRLHPLSPQKTTFYWRLTTLLVLSVNSLSIGFLSIMCVMGAILIAQYLFLGNSFLRWGILMLYALGFVGTLLLAPRFLKQRLQRPSDSPGQVSWAVKILSGISGMGVLLGTYFGRKSYGMNVALYLGLVGAMLLLPMAAVSLYQLAVMAWDWVFSSNQDKFS